MAPLAALFAVALAWSPALAERDRRLLDTYRGMLAEDPEQDYALRRLLEVSHAVGGVVGLIALYEAEVDAQPGAWSSWMVLGHLQVVADNRARAVEAYERAAELRPRAAAPHAGLARLHRRQRDWARAFAAYERAVERTGDRPRLQELLREAAEVAVEAERREVADGFFERLVRTEPQNLSLRMQWAATLARLGEVPRARTIWEELEERARGRLDQLVTIWKELGDLQLAQGDLVAAEATWRRALDRLPAQHWERRTFLDGLIAVYRRDDRLRDLVAELEPQVDRHHETRLTVARLYEELADDARALALYRDAVRQRPSDVQARLALIRVLERTGPPEELVEALRALVRATPGEPRHELRLAELLFRHGESQEGHALLDRTGRRYAQDPGVQQRLVDLWMRHGEEKTRDRLERQYQLLMRLEPHEDSHVISLGELYWTHDDRPRAVATWRRLLRMGRSPGDGHFMLGEVYAERGLLDEAQLELAKAAELEPDNARFARAYARLLEQRGDVGRALAVWSGLLDGGGLVARDARRQIITLWERARLLERQIDLLERRFAQDPPDAEAGRFLADAYLHLRRHGDAERVLVGLRALDPHDVDTLSGLELAYSRQNKLSEAIAVLEELARVSSRTASDSLRRAAELALALGDEGRALRYARQVVDLDPASAAAHQRVGDLYARLGYRGEAGEAWRQALLLDPRSDELRFRLAGLYRELGQAVREEQVLTEVVRGGRDHADILRAGQRLVQLAAAVGRLDQVEATLTGLVASARARAAYLTLLVDVFHHRGQELLASASGDAQGEALRALGARALRPLLDALVDADVALRGRALDVLELTLPAGAVPTLARMAHEGDQHTQVRAATILGRIGTEPAVAALARLAASLRRPLSRLPEWALGLASSADAVAALEARLDRALPADRVLVAAALGRGAHPSAFPVLERLVRDRSVDLREAALWGIVRIAPEEAVPILADRLRSGVGREVALAVEGLGRIDTPEAWDVLVRALYSRPELASDRLWSALALGRRPLDEAWVAAFYDQLVERERALVAQPSAALYLFPAPALEGAPGGAVVARHRDALREHLGVVLSGMEPRRQELLFDALLAGDRLSLVPVGSYPADAEVNHRATLAALEPHAARVLAIARGDAATTVLSGRALELAARWSRAAPGIVDAGVVLDEAIDVLRTAGRGPERLSALRAVAQLGAADPRLEPVLAGLAVDLEDATAVGERAALAALLAPPVGAGAVSPRLALLARDLHAVVRESAARALGVTGGEGGLALLLELVEDPAPDVARAAIASLAARPDPRAQETLRELAEGGDAVLALAARAALACPAGAACRGL